MSTDHSLKQRDAVPLPPETVQTDSSLPVEQAESAIAPPVSAPSAVAPLAAAPSVVEAVDESSTPGDVRRVRLNPTVGASPFRAVPSLPPQAPSSAVNVAPVAVESPASAESAAVDSAPPQFEPKRPPAAPPVEIPAVVKELDAELEAEIEAAMSSGELDPLAGSSSGVASAGSSDAPEKPPEELLEPGQHLSGRIQAIHSDSVFLELGYRSPGVVTMRQFVSGKKPEVGQLIEVVVDRVAHDEGLIHLNLPKGIRRVAGNWESLSKGQLVDCLVNRTNKGGLEVTVGGLRAFLPSSQIELGFVTELDGYVGQKLRVEVIEVNQKKRNLVVSRRAYLQIEREEAEEKLWLTLDVGQTFSGQVKTIKDYGAFVDLGGVDGFLHIGEMSWQRIKHPSEVVKEGQQVDVKVLSLDREKKKISVGMKQLAQNPWTTAADKYPANSTVTGKVTRVADFGAFVELEPGLEGLVHVSEIDHKHVRRVADVLKVHQVVAAQVLEVDVDRKRVSLSIKALLAKPEQEKPEEDRAPGAGEAYQRKRKEPLKGGTGNDTPRGLFGNPGDFH